MAAGSEAARILRTVGALKCTSQRLCFNHLVYMTRPLRNQAVPRSTALPDNLLRAAICSRVKVQFVPGDVGFAS
jgi:hypothetical protein